MPAKRTSNRELKRKYAQFKLQEESVKKSARNLQTCEQLKIVSEQVASRKEQTRLLDIEEAKISTEQKQPASA